MCRFIGIEIIKSKWAVNLINLKIDDLISYDSSIP